MIDTEQKYRKWLKRCTEEGYIQTKIDELLTEPESFEHKKVIVEGIIEETETRTYGNVSKLYLVLANTDKENQVTDSKLLITYGYLERSEGETLGGRGTFSRKGDLISIGGYYDTEEDEFYIRDFFNHSLYRRLYGAIEEGQDGKERE